MESPLSRGAVAGSQMLLVPVHSSDPFGHPVWFKRLGYKDEETKEGRLTHEGSTCLSTWSTGSLGAQRRGLGSDRLLGGVLLLVILRTLSMVAYKTPARTGLSHKENTLANGMHKCRSHWFQAQLDQGA